MPVKIAEVDQVLLQVRVEPEHPLGHRGRPEPGDELERPGRSVDDSRGEPIAGGAADQGRIGLVAQPQPVLGDEPSQRTRHRS